MNMSDSIRDGCLFGGISLIAPGRSATSSRAFFSGGPSLDEGGGDGRLVWTVPVAVEPTAPDVVVVDGFFKPLRDGGGGASSIKPCDRNWELNVLTVFGRWSELRTSMEIDAFLLAFAGDDLLLSTEESDLSSVPSLGFLGILSNLLDGEDVFDRPSLSLLEWVDFSLSLCSRCLSFELLLLLLLDAFEDEECL